MHGLGNRPVISSLHDSIQCDLNDCLHNFEGDKEVFVQDLDRFRQIELAPYHSCVKIVNNVTSAFTPPPLSSSFSGATKKKQLVWYSSNSDDVGLLLIQLFSYYSVKSHFKGVSITDKHKRHHSTPTSLGPECWVSKSFYEGILAAFHAIVFKRIKKLPYYRRRCSENMLDTIAKKISIANEMLESGCTYENICPLK